MLEPCTVPRRAAIGAALLALAAPAVAQHSSLAADEEVVLFPSYAQRIDAAAPSWRVIVRGQVFEPERDSRWRVAALDAAVAALDVAADDVATCRARLQPFLVDNERGQRIVVAIGERRFELAESGADGHFAGEIELTDAELGARADDAAAGPTACLRIVMPPGDARRFEASVHCLGRRGTSIVSDVDDTVRIAGAADARARVRAALVGEYDAVPGMAEAYRALAARGAGFHWLTSAPWQLHAPYAEFLARERFPPGSLHMRQFRLKDASVLKLLAAPRAHKERVLREIIAAFPQRQFVLVGDAVEDDPEVYAALASRFRAQVVRVLIRDGAEEGAAVDAARLARAFAGAADGVYRVFRDAAEIEGLLRDVFARGEAGGRGQR